MKRIVFRESCPDSFSKNDVLDIDLKDIQNFIFTEGNEVYSHYYNDCVLKLFRGELDDVKGVFVDKDTAFNVVQMYKKSRV